jgi:nucleoside-diphosphate-sugar epimerase|tara:strand:+ start:6014 stop:6235 length:222 start_codon:yes stop_codon:yes gene_type:complete
MNILITGGAGYAGSYLAMDLAERGDFGDRGREPAAYLVLPWHFRDEIVAREKDYLNRGGKLIFPLPTLSVVEG